MQISKNHIKRNITNAALKLFKAKDYSSVSMREIASEAQVGLSNIYNYLRSKDELFCHIVQPAVSSFERMLVEHHGYEGKDIMEMQSETNYCLLNYIGGIKFYVFVHLEIQTVLIFL